MILFPSTLQGAFAGAGWTLVAVVTGMIIRQIGPWRKLSIDAEQRLRDDLLSRVESLETQLAAQAAKYEKQIKEQGDSFQARLDSERVDHDNTIMVMRHKLNNITACFDAFLMLVKANPEKAGEAVVMVEEMRAKQVIAEATEKATLRGAMAAASGADSAKDLQ